MLLKGDFFLPLHYGGWRICRDLNDITLLYIYQGGVGINQLFAIGRGDEAPHCAVEAAVIEELGSVLAEAEQKRLSRFKEVTQDLPE